MKVKMKRDVNIPYAECVTFKEGRKYKVIRKTMSCYVLQYTYGAYDVHKGYCEVCFIRRLLNKY